MKRRDYLKGASLIAAGASRTANPSTSTGCFSVCPASSKLMHPCAWKGHSGKYSVPGEERGEMKTMMGKYLDDAIDAYLR